jgi:branched-chain amino acid aminotransferase
VTDFRSMTSVDGVITPTEDARVPVIDRGFLYGDSVYEVFRTYRGVPLLYEEHWSRLENSAGLIYMQIDRSRDEIGEAIRSTIEATGAPRLGVDVYVRYSLTRGDSSLDLYPEGQPQRLVVIVRQVPDWKPELYSSGLAVAIPDTRRNALDALDPNIKGGNYLNNVLGLIGARTHGADDCLMLNDAGLITEGSNSNVFFVIDGELVTPSQSAANLKGLTKMAVRSIAARHGIPNAEVEISPEDAARATESFFSSATREIMPVHTLRLEDGEVIEFPKGGGKLTRRLRDLYREFVDDYVETHRQFAMW